MIIECIGNTHFRQFRDYGGPCIGATLPPFGHRRNGRRAGRHIRYLARDATGKPVKLWRTWTFDICVPYYLENGPYWTSKRQRHRTP